MILPTTMLHPVFRSFATQVDEQPDRTKALLLCAELIYLSNRLLAMDADVDPETREILEGAMVTAGHIERLGDWAQAKMNDLTRPYH